MLCMLLKCLTFVPVIYSYRQNIPVSYLGQEMSFENAEKCLEFLAPFGLSYTDISRTSVDCKTSMAAIVNI